MEKHKLAEFKRGWFLGSFRPTLYDTEEFEVAVKRYSKGDIESSHYHNVATEWTVVVQGKVSMNDVIFEKEEIAVVYPGEIMSFEALEDAVTLVVKSPSVKNDKFTI